MLSSERANGIHWLPSVYTLLPVQPHLGPIHPYVPPFLKILMNYQSVLILLVHNGYILDLDLQFGTKRGNALRVIKYKIEIVSC